MTIGESIRKIRKSNKITQAQLAARLGVSASMIGQYETGVRNPKLSTLASIADALNVSIADICNNTSYMESLTDSTFSEHDKDHTITKLENVINSHSESASKRISVALASLPPETIPLALDMLADMLEAASQNQPVHSELTREDMYKLGFLMGQAVTKK